MINGSTADLLWVMADTGKSNGNINRMCGVHSSSERAEGKCSMFFSLNASETDPPLLLFKERECVHCDDIRRVVLSLITVPLRVHPTPPWKMTYEEQCLRASILTFFVALTHSQNITFQSGKKINETHELIAYDSEMIEPSDLPLLIRFVESFCGTFDK